MSSDTDSPGLFVWRGEMPAITSLYQYSKRTCPFCSGPMELIQETSRYAGIDTPVCDADWDVTACAFCGWSFRSRVVHEWFPFVMSWSKVLRSFDVNDREVLMSELGSHLRRNFGDVGYVSPRRFEELVNDIFKNHGYESVMTQQSRDGGADLLIYENGEVSMIVECKRWANKVGLEVVDRLIGACIRWGTRRAVIVTTNSFTSPAVSEAKALGERGFELDLVDATDLLRMLRVYRDDMPGLDKIDPTTHTPATRRPYHDLDVSMSYLFLDPDKRMKQKEDDARKFREEYPELFD